MISDNRKNVVSTKPNSRMLTPAPALPNQGALMRRKWPVVCLSLLLVIGSVAPLAADAPRNTKPFTRFKVFLQGMLNDTLPFDVPFIVWGDVPDATADHLTLSIAIIDKNTTCGTVPVGKFQVADRVEVLKWAQTDYADRDLAVPGDLASATRKQFEVLVKPLAPNKFYCFLFQVEPGRPLRNTETMALIAQVRPAYLAFIESLGRVEVQNVADPDVEPLRRRIAEAVINAVPLKMFRPKPGSVFDPEAPADAVAAEFKRFEAAVLQAHNNVLDKLDEFQATTEPFRTERENAVNACAAWSNDAAFRALANDPALTDPQRALVAEFAGLAMRDCSNLFVGLPKGAPSEVLTDVKHDLSLPPPVGIYPDTHPCPADGDLNARCRLLDDTRERLGQLASLVDAQARALPAGPPRNRLIEIANQIALRASPASTARRLGTQKTRLLDLQHAANERFRAIDRHVQRLEGLVATEFRALTTTVGNFDTRKAWYVSMDTGLAIAPGLNEVFPYVGSNIYFRPVNKEAPPTVFLSRFSMLLGFTWTSNLNKPGETRPLYGANANILLGAGLRATDVLRLTGGVLVLKGVNPNPLIDRTRIEITPFFSISADIDVAGILTGVFGANKAPATLGAGSPPK
jgi:hypothetical protein